MPESPEVETVRRIIEPQLAGQSILSVKVYHPQIIAHPAAEAFPALLACQTFARLSRRGKFLSFHFESGARLVLHLRMTGQLLVTSKDFPEEKHTHLVAELSGGQQMRYIDVRRFGRFWYLAEDEQDLFTGWDKLGVEPFSAELSGSYLREKLGSRKTPIKEMLLDQTVVAGIGNIYSDEILFSARIHPRQQCCELSTRAWNRLAREIKQIMQWGVESNAMTPEEYLAGKGKEYRNTPELKVYGREGEPCVRCGKTIRRIVLGGRSSCFCPNCQRKKRQSGR